MKKRKKLRSKIIMFFLLFMVIVSISLGGIILYISSNNTARNIELVLEAGARYIEDIYSGAVIRDISNTREEDLGKEYDLVLELLERVKTGMGLDRVCILKPLYDEYGVFDGDVEFLFDSVSGDYWYVDPKKFRETGNLGEDAEHIRKLITSNYVSLERDQAGRVSSRSYGEAYAFYHMVDLPDGTVYAIVCTEISDKRVLRTALRTSLQIVLWSLIIITVCMLIFIWFVNRDVIKPILRLSEHMQRFVGDETHLNYIPFTGIKTHDEIESMAENFNKMAQAILAYTKKVEKKAVEQERIRADLDVTRQIRASVSSEMLYPAFPERNDFDLCASIKNTVNNRFSFCNYFLTDEEHLFIVIGESVGSGLPAMMLSALASTNVHCFAKMGYSPYRIAVETNNVLCNLEKHDNGMTVGMLIAQIDLLSGELKYVSAGMPPLLVKRTGEEFVPEDTPIQFNVGEMRGVSFTEQTIQLCQGNMLVFTSEGVPEMKNESGSIYSEAKLTWTLNEISAHTYELDRMVFELEESLEKFRGTREPDTDTAVAVFRYFG